MKKVLYFGWLGHQNIGDELMWDIFQDLFLKKFSSSQYKLISSTKNIRNRLKNDNHYLKSFDIIVLGGGSILMPTFVNTLYKAIQLHPDVKILIWGSGIDWIERKDLNRYFLNNSQGRTGIRTEFNRFPKNWFQNVLQVVLNHSQFISLRGTYTYEILTKKGVHLQNAIVSGDPGLLLNPLPKDPPVIRNEKLITINWGTTMNRLYGKNEAKLEGELTKVINALVNKGYEICIFPVWTKDIRPCMNLYKKLENKKNITLIKQLMNQQRIMELYERSAFSINLKLHANVLSAVSKTPFVAMGYRFKTFDFANYIGMDKLVVPTDDSQFAVSTMEAVKLIDKHGIDMMKSIAQHQETCRKNLDTMFDYF